MARRQKRGPGPRPRVTPRNASAAAVDRRLALSCRSGGSIFLLMDGGDLLLIPEVAQIARVSPETVRFWIKRGKLPSIRPGRRRMVRRTALEAFLAGGATPAVPTRTKH